MGRLAGRQTVSDLFLQPFDEAPRTVGYGQPVSVSGLDNLHLDGTRAERPGCPGADTPRRAAGRGKAESRGSMLGATTVGEVGRVPRAAQKGGRTVRPKRGAKGRPCATLQTRYSALLP